MGTHTLLEVNFGEWRETGHQASRGRRRVAPLLESDDFAELFADAARRIYRDTKRTAAARATAIAKLAAKLLGASEESVFDRQADFQNPRQQTAEDFAINSATRMSKRSVSESVDSGRAFAAALLGTRIASGTLQESVEQQSRNRRVSNFVTAITR